jgi:hypothetical protein
MNRHELAEAVARLVHLTTLDQAADVDRNPRVVRERRRKRATGKRRRCDFAVAVVAITRRPNVTIQMDYDAIVPVFTV